MKQTPAHLGLFPQPFVYAEVTDVWSKQIRKMVGAEQVRRAIHHKRPPLGYYRIATNSGAELFGKVVSTRDAQRETLAAELSTAAAIAGLPAVGLYAKPVALDSSHVLFLWPWIEGQYASGGASEMMSLGASLARLHQFFTTCPMDDPLQGSIDEHRAQWKQLEALAESSVLPTALAGRLHDFLSRRISIDEHLFSDAQTLHNDLHLGNVLFDLRGEILAFLDFDEALRSRGSPWIDISWVLERFCQQSSEFDSRLGRLFLDAYQRVAPSLKQITQNVLIDAAEWRNFRALAILNDSPNKTSVEWATEWDKFQHCLLKCRMDMIALGI